MIPGLERPNLSVMEAFTATPSSTPDPLDPCLRWRDQDRIYVAGQIAGAEGYIESAAVGLLAGISVAADKTGRSFSPPPPTTAHGALICHLTTAPRKDFQPMNINFGLFPPLTVRLPARQRGASYARRALEDLEAWRTQW
jgi:methylenetetrahydrofolate--tRNA-(uracil-5-)-methyltransferase